MACAGGRAQRKLTLKISGKATASLWEEAIALFHSIQPELKLDAICFGALLNAFQKAAEWRKALELLAQAEAVQSVDIFSYNSTISACSKASQWEKALMLLNLFPKLKIEPDAARNFSKRLSSFRSDLLRSESD